MADDHDPVPPQVPGERAHREWEPERDVVAPDPAYPDMPVPASAGAIARPDPRPLPQTAGLALQAALDLTEQELQAGLELHVQAELMFRKAGLLLVRGASGDREAALQVLESLTTDPRFVNFRRRDEGLFYLAFESVKAGEVAGFKRAAMELIRSHPASEWVPETYLLFADFYFDAAQPDHAHRFYQKVADGYPNTDAAVYATYRSGWCTIDADPQQSLMHFVRAVERGAGRTSQDASLVLEAARRDIPWAYARVGKPGKALAFFRRVGRSAGSVDHSGEMMQGLVLAYRDLGDTAAAQQVCADLTHAIGVTEVCAGR